MLGLSCGRQWLGLSFTFWLAKISSEVINAIQFLFPRLNLEVSNRMSRLHDTSRMYTQFVTANAKQAHKGEEQPWLEFYNQNLRVYSLCDTEKNSALDKPRNL